MYSISASCLVFRLKLISVSHLNGRSVRLNKIPTYYFVVAFIAFIQSSSSSKTHSSSRRLDRLPFVFCIDTAILCIYEAPQRGVRFTNSRTIFWIFTNSRTREKWQFSRFQERDFVNSRTTINKYAGIHEFTNKFFNFP